MVADVFNNEDVVTDIQEVSQLPGYQYLTNYLLLNLHDKMVKDINCQSMKIDELENLLKGGCGEISLESFFWYEKVTRFSKIINANMEKIDRLQLEILNGKKNCDIMTEESAFGHQYDPHSDTFVKEAIDALFMETNVNRNGLDKIQKTCNDHRAAIDLCSLAVQNIQTKLDAKYT